MRKLLLGLCIFTISTVFGSESRYLSFEDGYVSQRKFEGPRKSITYGDSYIDVKYDFDGAYIKLVEQTSEKGRIDVFMDNAYYIADRMVFSYSCERLPYYKDILVLPENATTTDMEIEVVKEKHYDYKCPVSESNLTELSNAKNYGKLNNVEDVEFSPDVEVKCVTKGTFRDIPFITVNTYPLTYDWETRDLRCYSSITYRIKYKTAENSAKMSKLAFDVLGRVASNPEILNKYDDKLLKAETSENKGGYLIVTKDSYKPAAEKLAAWKSRIGYRCMIYSKPIWEVLNKENVSDSIHKYCNNLQYKPDYILIIGSHDDVPSYRYGDVGGYSSDCKLGSLERKSVHYDDMVKGRISIYSLEEANNVVDKIIAYERNPPVNEDFYNNVLSISYFQTDGIKNRESETMDFYSSSEGLSIDLSELGYNIDRHSFTCNEYGSGAAITVPQYLNNGEKLPEGCYMEDESGNDFWDKDPSHITDLLNKGKSFVYYRGHGNDTSYSGGTYTPTDLLDLKNGNKTPVFFNFTCSTGNFHYKEEKNTLCFAEALLNKKDGGAVGVLANTNPTIHFESNLMATSVFRELFKNQDISVATAALQASFYTESEDTRRVSQWFGDPSMKMYTVVPAQFTPFINRLSDEIIVIGPGVSGSKVTVCSIGDMGKSYFKTFDLTSQTSISIKDINVPCYISITKANYVPYLTVSQANMNLQNMTLNGYHDISTENITSGKNITKNVEEGPFIVESGETKFTASKKISLKSGTSIKDGAKFSARRAELKSNVYNGNGKPRTKESVLCFSSLSNRFITDDIFQFEGDNYGNKENPTAITDKSENSNPVAIYPNPTSGLINVVANDIINSVVVLDMTGNTLISESANSNNISLDLSSLGKGLYLVKVVTADDSLIKKVVLK